jgi:hypothetical protein
MTPWSSPWTPRTPSSFFLPRVLSLPLYFSSPRSTAGPEHGCRLSPPLGASPASSELAPSTASPPSSSSPKESVGTARNHRRLPPFPCRNRPRHRRNTPPSILLRPSRPHRRPPGEVPVLLDPSPSFSPRRSAVPVATGGSPAMAVACPGHWPAWPAMWAMGPSSRSLWVK